MRPKKHISIFVLILLWLMTIGSISAHEIGAYVVGPSGWLNNEFVEGAKVTWEFDYGDRMDSGTTFTDAWGWFSIECDDSYYDAINNVWAPHITGTIHVSHPGYEGFGVTSWYEFVTNDPAIIEATSQVLPENIQLTASFVDSEWITLTWGYPNLDETIEFRIEQSLDGGTSWDTVENVPGSVHHFLYFESSLIQQEIQWQVLAIDMDTEKVIDRSNISTATPENFERHFTLPHNCFTEASTITGSTHISVLYTWRGNENYDRYYIYLFYADWDNNTYDMYLLQSTDAEQDLVHITCTIRKPNSDYLLLGTAEGLYQCELYMPQETFMNITPDMLKSSGMLRVYPKRMVMIENDVWIACNSVDDITSFNVDLMHYDGSQQIFSGYDLPNIQGCDLLTTGFGTKPILWGVSNYPTGASQLYLIENLYQDNLQVHFDDSPETGTGIIDLKASTYSPFITIRTLYGFYTNGESGWQEIDVPPGSNPFEIDRVSHDWMVMTDNQGRVGQSELSEINWSLEKDEPLPGTIPIMATGSLMSLSQVGSGAAISTALMNPITWVGGMLVAGAYLYTLPEVHITAPDIHLIQEALDQDQEIVQVFDPASIQYVLQDILNKRQAAESEPDPDPTPDRLEKALRWLKRIKPINYNRDRPDDDEPTVKRLDLGSGDEAYVALDLICQAHGRYREDYYTSFSDAYWDFTPSVEERSMPVPHKLIANVDWTALHEATNDNRLAPPYDLVTISHPNFTKDPPPDLNQIAAVLREGGELRIGFLSHDLQRARDMGYLDDMETIFNSKIRKQGIIDHIMLPIAPPCVLDTMVIVRLNRSTVPYDFALGKTHMMNPILGLDVFLQTLRQGNHVQPPDKDLYNWLILQAMAETGSNDYDELYNYLMLNGPDHQLFPDEIEHWVHPEKNKSLFYLYSFFADTLHFLYDDVDLVKAFSATPVNAAMPSIAEWELQTIKNDPSLTAKLKCYLYHLNGQSVHLVGRGEQCLQEFDTGVNGAWYDFFFQFWQQAQSNQVMPGHKGRIEQTTAEQLILSVSSRFDLREIQPDSIKLLIDSDIDSTVWAPDSVVLEKCHYRVDHEVMGSKGCMAFLAPDHKVSQLYYRIFDQNHIQQETLTIDSTMSFFVPSADMREISSRLFFAQYMGKVIGEENYGTRYAYLSHLASDRVCSGTLYFYCPDHVVSQTASLSVFRLQENGSWHRIPTVFDASGGYCWANINEGGTFTLFDNPEPVLSVTPHRITVPAAADSLTLSIDNSNVGVMDWSVSSDASWLTLSGDMSG
ncbi:hypothetical protein GF406_04870, partial [candidate division KSB1 bacterium]|nr:hypothetical protein [candidate division KSB1 bacterium]